MSDGRAPVEPQTAKLRDDGTFPNSELPLLVYSAAFEPATVGADDVEERFHANDWRGSWRNGVYSGWADVDENIAAVPVPETDPLYGPDGPLRSLWQAG